MDYMIIKNDMIPEIHPENRCDSQHGSAKKAAVDSVGVLPSSPHAAFTKHNKYLVKYIINKRTNGKFIFPKKTS